MTETKTKKKPVKFDDVAAFTKILRILEPLPFETRVRLCRQLIERTTEEASQEERKRYEERVKSRDEVGGIQPSPLQRNAYDQGKLGYG